jgi:hypothetical protein
MKIIRMPLIILTLFCIGFLYYLFQSTAELSSRVAIHFAADGDAIGWMRRTDYRLSMGVIGIGLPLALALIGAVLCFFFSRRAYWSGPADPPPEDRPHAGVYLLRFLLWLGGWVVCFITGIQYFIVEANNSQPAKLSVAALAAVGVTFLAGVVIWIARLVRALRGSGPV